MKKDYMARLERAARWRLPRQEAEDVVADYREIVGTPPRPEEELLRDLGKPRDVIRPLVQKREYYTWLGVFAVLAFCILIPGASPHAFFYRIWDMCFAGSYLGGGGEHWGPILVGIGLAGSLVWFRWKEQKGEQRPKALLILAAVLVAWCGALLLVNWLVMRDPMGFAAMWGEKPLTYFGIPLGPNGGTMVSRSMEYLKAFLQNGGTIAAFIGVFGLIKARTEDRRWAAVYALTMAVMLISMESLTLWTDAHLDYLMFLDTWWHHYMRCYLLVAAAGVGAAGVALC